MGQKRNNYNSKLKLQVVMELIVGNKTQSQITSEYGIHPSQQNRWKQQFLENADTIFDNKRKQHCKEQNTQKLIDSLYSQLGKVTMEKQWLEKKIGELPNIFGKT